MVRHTSPYKLRAAASSADSGTTIKIGKKKGMSIVMA